MNDRASRLASGLIIGLLLGSALAACATGSGFPGSAESLHLSGVTDVAVIHVEPWNSVAQSLTPSFDISPESALRQVIPNTSEEVDRWLDALRFRLGVGLPGSTTMRERTEIQKFGEALTSQATTTQRTEAGRAPDLPTGSPSGDRTAKDLPGTDVLARELEQEPVLRYKAAVALFQEVKLLNRYVQGAYLGSRSQYEPYLVRLQITLMPVRRDLPDDAYVHISFFTSTSDHSPFVVPLVVTDAFEGSQTSSASEVIRQLGLALGGTVSNVGIGADAQSQRDALHALSGKQLNSLQTISRLGDNGIRVRLGAVKKAVPGDVYVMVPRTYNVTLLLLVDKKWNEKQQTEKQQTEKPLTDQRVEMTAITYFFDTRSGKPLPIFSRKEQPHSMAYDVGKYILGDDGKQKCVEKGQDPCTADKLRSYPVTGQDECKKEDVDLLTYLWRQVAVGNTFCFDRALEYCSSDLCKWPLARRVLWSELAILKNSYGYTNTKFQLPRVPKTELPPKQTVLLMDDEKATATALLLNGVALAPDRIVASLVVKQNGGDFEIPASSVSLDGSALRLTFPSLAKTGVTENREFAGGGRGEIHLLQRADTWEPTEKDDFPPCPHSPETRSCPYPVKLRVAPVPTESGLKFETAINTVPVKAGESAGQISVYLTFDGAASAKITATGGEIRTASLPNEKGSPGQGLAIEGGVVLVTASAGKPKSRIEALLTLGNLVDGGTLKVVATGFDKDGKRTAEAPAVSVAIKRDQPTGNKDSK